jgi:hypothetical protein
VYIIEFIDNKANELSTIQQYSAVASIAKKTVYLMQMDESGSFTQSFWRGSAILNIPTENENKR